MQNEEDIEAWIVLKSKLNATESINLDGIKGGKVWTKFMKYCHEYMGENEQTSTPRISGRYLIFMYYYIKSMTRVIKFRINDARH